MQKLVYRIGRMTEEEQLRLDFIDGLSRTVEDRISLGFIPLRIPVMDEMPYRIFETVAAYRTWSEDKLPRFLGYYR
jgi:hypothetical protein